jgi:hypothetical protein
MKRHVVSVIGLVLAAALLLLPGLHSSQAEPVVSNLYRGWNAFVNLAPGKPIADALVGINGKYGLVCRLNGQQQEWECNDANGPPALNKLQRLDRFASYTIFMNEEASLTHDADLPRLSVNTQLHAGWQLFSYLEEDLSVSDALAPLAGKYRTICLLKGGQQDWDCSDPNAPATLNELQQLEQFSAYMISMTEAGELTFDLGINPAEFHAQVDNPFFPLNPGDMQVHEGENTDEETGETFDTRVESTVLAETKVIASFTVRVVEVKDFEDGELVERTLDYYAQHNDGTVYYIGEDVDDYENGVVVGHTGQRLSGDGDNQPGIFMPANPQVGDEFEQERAPGIADDRSKVVAVNQAVTTPAGAFSGCIKTEDFDPLGNAKQFKFYCPGIGLVGEESDDAYSELISY